VMTASPDFGPLGPMLTAARRELAAAGVTDAPGVVVADAGYWHLEQMNDMTAGGIPLLIPPDSSRRKASRPGWHGGAYGFMRRAWTPTTPASSTSNEPSSSSRSSATSNTT